MPGVVGIKGNEDAAAAEAAATDAVAGKAAAAEVEEAEGADGAEVGDAHGEVAGAHGEEPSGTAAELVDPPPDADEESSDGESSAHGSLERLKSAQRRLVSARRAMLERALHIEALVGSAESGDDVIGADIDGAGSGSDPSQWLYSVLSEMSETAAETLGEGRTPLGELLLQLGLSDGAEGEGEGDASATVLARLDEVLRLGLLRLDFASEPALEAPSPEGRVLVSSSAVEEPTDELALQGGGSEALTWHSEVVASPLTLAAFAELHRDPTLQAALARRQAARERAEDLRFLREDVEEINEAARRYHSWELLWADAMLKLAKGEPPAAIVSSSTAGFETVEGKVASLALERTRRRRTLSAPCKALLRRAEVLGVAPALTPDHLCHELSEEF